MTEPYRICTRCVMNTSDPGIVFDAAGVCNHCHAYEDAVATRVRTGSQAEAQLAALCERIRADGRSKDYDCIIGVSGGVDSSYVAYLVKQLGLRPLAVHLDNGWDSELAVKNIESILKRLGIELYTHVLDWEEFKDLQLAFLRASTPDSEIPSDHAIFAVMRHVAAKQKVRYVISGVNVRTESHLPRAWSQGHMDWRYIRSVHRRFGTRGRLRTFPHLTLLDLYRYRATQEWVEILNFVEYDKARAKRVLIDELGWRDYGGKHFESVYTRFYQGYLLPRKFGYDKRRSHLSSLICSGQIARSEALRELEQEPYPVELQASDRKYVAKKFGLSEAEFDAIMALPPRSYHDYPNHQRIYSSRAYLLGQAVFRHARSLAQRLRSTGDADGRKTV
jgi:N-acetyl sugar amidotransferase